MRTINKIDSPAREKVLSSYDQILLWGKEEGREEGTAKGREEGREEGREVGREEGLIRKSFQVFKKGVPMGLQMADLITLTDVSEETARTWYALLSENPVAELPGE